MTIYNEQGEEWIPNPRSKLLEKEESLFQKTREVCMVLSMYVYGLYTGVY